MTSLLKGPTIDTPGDRRLLQDLYITEADILPHPKKNLLKVQVHNGSRPAANKEYDKLFIELNAAEIYYPGTDMKVMYELVNKNSGK